MHKKSFTFGMGTGILAMTALFFFVYGAVKMEWEKAREILIHEKEVAVEASQTLPERVGMTELEAIDYAESLGMRFPTLGDEQTETPPSDTPELMDAEPTDESPAPSESEPPEESPKPSEESQTPEPSAPPVPTQSSTPTPMPTSFVDDEGWITFTVPEGLNARAVCTLLAQQGVVEDADDLAKYLTENGLTTKLAHGTYRVPLQCSYDELMTYWRYIQ